jgi:hypothetical protein
MLEPHYSAVSWGQGKDILRTVIKLCPAADALTTSYSCWLLCGILLTDYPIEYK